MKRRLLLAAPLGLAGAAHGRTMRCGQSLRFPVSNATADLRSEFSLQLLTEALAAGGCTSTLGAQVTPGMAEVLQGLREGRLDVGAVASVVDAQAAGLRVVPVPIRRGLLGVRLFVCRVTRAAEFSEMRSLDELRQRSVIGYGADWADIDEYRRLGFRLATADSYAGLFELLHGGQADLLSRGVNEIWDEVDSGEHGRGELMTVPNIGMTYPLDHYFVVRPDASDLHAALTQGLQALQRSGRYQALFDEHYRLSIRRSELAYRQLFALPGYRPDQAIARAQNRLLYEARRRQGTLP